MTNEQNLVCPQYHNWLDIKNESCEFCGLEFTLEAKSLKYDSDSILSKNHYKQFLLSKALNNNGFISYIELSEGSLSLSNRPEVRRFREFIDRSLKSRNGLVCDVGCGPLEKPGYISDNLLERFKVFGLDPALNTNYFVFFIKGCAEYLPFENFSLNALIFASSIDHVVNLTQVIRESSRVLEDNGYVIIWMSDKSKPKRSFVRRFKLGLKNLLKWLKSPSTYRSVIYDNNTVLSTSWSY